MSVKVHFVPPDRIDLRDWKFFEEDDPWGGMRDILMKGFAAQVTETLRSEFEKYPPSLEFVGTFDDTDRETDPAKLNLLIPLGATADEPVIYSCLLEDVIDFMIEVRVEHKDRNSCIKLAARLRELASKLDSAIPDTEAA